MLAPLSNYWPAPPPLPTPMNDKCHICACQPQLILRRELTDETESRDRRQGVFLFIGIPPFTDEENCHFKGASVAQWVTRWPTDLAVPGLSTA